MGTLASHGHLRTTEAHSFVSNTPHTGEIRRWSAWIQWMALTLLWLPVLSSAAQPHFSASGRPSQADDTVTSSGQSGGGVSGGSHGRSFSASAGGNSATANATATGSGIWYPSSSASVTGIIRVSNPSALASLLGSGQTQVLLRLSVSAGYNLATHPTPGIFDQATASVSFSASGPNGGASGSANIQNGPYDHDHDNFGLFSGLPESGGGASHSLSILVTPSGTTPVEYSFSVSVTASAMDLSNKAAATANITASFSSSLSNASGQPIDMDGLGITIQPLPTPDKTQDYTGTDEHTSIDECRRPPMTGESSKNGRKGMAAYNFHTMLASLIVTDTPVGYDPPFGPPVPFTVTYTQKEASQPSVFTYSNFGPKWNFNWLAYITDNPADVTAVSGQGRPGGGRLSAAFISTTGGYHAYRLLGRPSMSLKRPVSGPLQYEIVHSDGSKEIYGQPDGTPTGPRKVFLTQRIDPAGNATILSYDAQMRITHITDALGQQTLLTYGHPGDPYKITKVTDPFGRFASFDYDTTGRLVKITDVIGIQSVFTYEGAGDFLNSLTTPYGTTTFTHTVNGTAHRLTATDPAGDTEVLESNLGITAQLPYSDTQSLVPTGMPAYNAELNRRNSFYWNKKRWKEVPNDYAKAHIYHWLVDSNFTSMSGTLESEKPPLQSRIWYSYPGQTLTHGIGTGRVPSKIGRVIEGGTQLSTRGISALDKVTSSTDPLGRTSSFSYSADGLDLTGATHLQGGVPVTLGVVTYNAQHRPLTITDAAGQTTTLTWNAVGQVTSVQNAKNETTTYAYYTADAPGRQRRGRLQSIDTALPGSADITTFDYDATGNLARVTGPDGYYLDHTYDALGRLTRTTYPDATYTETTFQALDPATTRDRLGRITTYVHNSLRQLASITDPANRKIQYTWCRCGDLKQLIDAMGRITTWRHDVASRVTAKEYTDGSKIIYNYEPLSGRLLSIIDEKQQVKTRRYNLDDTLAGIAYTNEEHETPDVSFTYETDYRRLATMIDGIGTTRYTYHPFVLGSLGAGQLASIDTPLPDDTLLYAYDALGRRTGYTINGVGESKTLDALGRIQAIVNPLGTFGYTYHGATSRMDTVTYPTGMTASYAWHPLVKDFRLKDIIHTLQGNQLLSRHSYEHNAAGNITRWTQIAPASGLNRSWQIGYDDADQLTSVASQDPVTLALQPTGQYAYSYDLAGNRLTEVIDGVTATATHNALNQLVSLSKSDGSTALPAQTYEWDAENRLTAINYTGTAKRSEFAYDGRGRRVRIVEKNSNTEIANQTYLWTGFEIAECRDATGDSVLQRCYSQGYVDTTTNIFLYTRDHLGSIREILDGLGVARERIGYGVWGTPTFSNEKPLTSFAFTGHLWHETSGLHLAPFRAYSAVTGRWISRDPINENGGVNLFAYVYNSPINQTDPLGLVVRIRNVDLVGGAATHSFVQVTHDNGSQNVVTTYSGYADSIWEAFSPFGTNPLIVEKNRGSDWLASFNGSTSSIVVPPPSGMTQGEWDNHVIASGDAQVKLSGEREYSIGGGDGGSKSGNCHAISSGIIEGAGGTIPNYDPNGYNPGLRTAPSK